MLYKLSQLRLKKGFDLIWHTKKLLHSFSGLILLGLSLVDSLWMYMNYKKEDINTYSSAIISLSVLSILGGFAICKISSLIFGWMFP